MHALSMKVGLSFFLDVWMEFVPPDIFNVLSVVLPNPYKLH